MCRGSQMGEGGASWRGDIHCPYPMLHHCGFFGKEKWDLQDVFNPIENINRGCWYCYRLTASANVIFYGNQWSNIGTRATTGAPNCHELWDNFARLIVQLVNWVKFLPWVLCWECLESYTTAGDFHTRFIRPHHLSILRSENSIILVWRPWSKLEFV